MGGNAGSLWHKMAVQLKNSLDFSVMLVQHIYLPTRSKFYF